MRLLAIQSDRGIKMELRVGEHGELIFGHVYNSIVLERGDPGSMDNTFAICMRDDGFEFKYGDTWYSAQGGFVGPSNLSDQELKELKGE